MNMIFNTLIPFRGYVIHVKPSAHAEGVEWSLYTHDAEYVEPWSKNVPTDVMVGVVDLVRSIPADRWFGCGYIH